MEVNVQSQVFILVNRKRVNTSRNQLNTLNERGVFR